MRLMLVAPYPLPLIVDETDLITLTSPDHDLRFAQ
jgi:hypothetical protein